MDDVRAIATPIHGRVLVRRASAPSSRFLVGFHGYLESAETQMARLAGVPGSERWTLVSVQALHRVYRGRSQDVVASWMTRQDRDQAIVDNIHYADAAIADAAAGCPSPAIVCCGFSQGTQMAFRAATRGAIAAAGIIGVGADVPPELLADPAVVFPPVLFARGARDEWMTPAMFDSDIQALRARGTLVRALLFDGGHEWNDEVASAAGAFLEQWR